MRFSVDAVRTLNRLIADASTEADRGNAAFPVACGRTRIQIGQLIFGTQGNERQKGIIVLGLFVSGGRNAERGMIALRVQDPTARHEEASNDDTVLRLSGRPVSS